MKYLELLLSTLLVQVFLSQFVLALPQLLQIIGRLNLVIAAAAAAAAAAALLDDHVVVVVFITFSLFVAHHFLFEFQFADKTFLVIILVLGRIIFLQSPTINKRKETLD
jgi:hypothetical protein